MRMCQNHLDGMEQAVMESALNTLAGQDPCTDLTAQGHITVADTGGLSHESKQK
jgi:hypothetical protein